MGRLLTAERAKQGVNQLSWEHGCLGELFGVSSACPLCVLCLLLVLRAVRPSYGAPGSLWVARGAGRDVL